MTQAKKSSNFPNLNIKLGEALLKPFLNKEKLTEPNERVKNVKKKIYFSGPWISGLSDIDSLRGTNEGFLKIIQECLECVWDTGKIIC